MINKTPRGANHGRGLHEGEIIEVDAIPPAMVRTGAA